MPRTDVLDRLAGRRITPDGLAKKVLKDSRLIPKMIKGMSDGRANVKFGCAKILRNVSERAPEKLYSRFDVFKGFLDHENNIIMWNAQDIIGNLTRVDRKNKFNRIFKKYYAMLRHESMVTAAHVIDNSSVIVASKPYLAEKVANELLKVEKIKRNPECRNILIGRAIAALGTFPDRVRKKGRVVNFARRALKNRRPSTKKKAKNFLNKFG